MLVKNEEAMDDMLAGLELELGGDMLAPNEEESDEEEEKEEEAVEGAQLQMAASNMEELLPYSSSLEPVVVDSVVGRQWRCRWLQKFWTCAARTQHRQPRLQHRQLRLHS